MSKQTKRILKLCQEGDCMRTATIGMYEFSVGSSDVDLNRPAIVVCGEHKLAVTGTRLRNVRLLKV